MCFYSVLVFFFDQVLYLHVYVFFGLVLYLHVYIFFDLISYLRMFLQCQASVRTLAESVQTVKTVLGMKIQSEQKLVGYATDSSYIC